MAKQSGPRTVRETERKYEAGEPLDPELVARVAAAGLTLGEPARHELVAVYYDTADLRLIRSRLTLRRRRGGSDAGWHLKLPAGADSRYGSGHAQATGGALRPADWNAFVQAIGFPDQQVPA